MLTVVVALVVGVAIVAARTFERRMTREIDSLLADVHRGAPATIATHDIERLPLPSSGGFGIHA